MGTDTELISRADLRRLLDHLRSPHALAENPAAGQLCPEHREAAPSLLGAEVARTLTDAIERLRPLDDTHEERLPYLVLKTVFVDGIKMTQASDRLLLSRRQLTRECARALDLLHRELSAAAVAPAVSAYTAEPVPTIAEFMARPDVLQRLSSEVEAGDGLVNVHGPKGIGKTSLVAEYAASVAQRRSVIWHRFRPGTNDTWRSLSFELAEFLKAQGQAELSDYLAESRDSADTSLVGRLLLRDLRDHDALFVFDDFHFAETDGLITSFLDEAATRLPSVAVITVGRHRPQDSTHPAFEVPPLSAGETHALLAHLGVRTKPAMAELIRDWTQGVTHLVRLAASWMKSASELNVSRGLDEFTQLDEVQDFLIDSVTEVLDRRDRVVLQAASVFRDRFTDSAVAYVAERTMGEVRDTSRQLVRCHIATRGRGGDVAFFHTSVREYFYVHLEATTAAKMHQRAAAWFESVGDPDESHYHRDRAASLMIDLAEPEVATHRSGTR